MGQLTCRWCKSSFDGSRTRGRRPAYCSIGCRRAIERRRAYWDIGYRYYSGNRDVEDRSDLQRQAWQHDLNEWLATFGPRP